MEVPSGGLLSRRRLCLCCIGGAAGAAAGGWLTPRDVFAEARGIVSLIKDSAAVSPIVTHKLRNNISVLEGSGGTVAVLSGPDGKVLVDAGIAVSRPQLMKSLTDLGADPITHLINTHWHFDHTSGNTWLNAAGARIIAQENTRKYLSQVQRVDDWDYNFRRGSKSALFGLHKARGNRRPVRVGFRLEGCPLREAASLPRSSSPGLKRSQAQQGEPVRMALAGHQFPWAFAVAFGTPAAHEAAVVQEEPQQVEIRATQVAAQRKVGAKPRVEFLHQRAAARGVRQGPAQSVEQDVELASGLRA